MDRQKQDAWRVAQRRCGLDDEEVRMAKELGFQPRSVIQSIPSPSQRWKAPVNRWIRSLYEEKFGTRRAPAPIIALRRPEQPPPPDDPWPDNPAIPELGPVDFDDDIPFDFESGSLEPPAEDDIAEEDVLMLRQQRLYRWAAQLIARAMSELPEVERVAAFGAVSRPLEREVPRFKQYRRHRVKVLHECMDLDLAVWVRNFGGLKTLKKAISSALALLQHTAYGGVPHHAIDVHLFDARTGNYAGQLCIFGECPKNGKRECQVRNCGAEPFLQRLANYGFRPSQLESERKVILVDRSTGFLVAPPKVKFEEPPRRTPRRVEFGDDDVPF